MLASATVMSFATGSTGRCSPGRASRPRGLSATSCADCGRDGAAGAGSGLGGAGFLAIGLEKKPMVAASRCEGNRPAAAGAGRTGMTIMFPS